MNKYVIASAIVLISSSSTVLAADLSPQAAEPAAPIVEPAVTWTGFYGGASVGYVYNNVKVRDTNGGVDPGPFKYHGDSVFGSAQLGYNYQINSFVVGVEGDVGYMGGNAEGTIQSAFATSHQNLTLDSGVYGDITGRLGYAFGPALIYAKGGFAFFDGESKQRTTNPGYVTTGTNTFTGWTAGAGVEYMVTQNWSVKLEYLHYDFGSKGGYQTNVGDQSSLIGFRFRNETDLTAETVKLGANYHF